MGILKRGVLIKRFPFPVVYREIVTIPSDDGYDNDVKSYKFTRFVAKGCTLQTLKDSTYENIEAGISSDQIFVLVTETPLSTATDGTPSLGCSVYVPDTFISNGLPSYPKQGGWFRVVIPSNSFNDVQNSCEAYLVKDPVMKDPEGLDKYPDIPNTIALLTDRTTLRLGGWIPTYTGDTP